MADNVFRVSPGDPISAETMNRVIAACNPQVGDGRAMPPKSKMIPASFLNTGNATIEAGTACLATWRDENADADVARKRFLRDGFCLQRTAAYEFYRHRYSDGEYSNPYQRYIPVTLLKTAAPGKIVPCYVSGIFAGTVRSNSADAVISEAFWSPDRNPYFFSRGERIARADSASYAFDVLAASAVKEAETNSQLRWDRFCILRPKSMVPEFVKDFVETIDENGTITGRDSGVTLGTSEYNKAVDEVQAGDTVYLRDGYAWLPVGLERGISEARSKAAQSLTRTETLANCVWWLYHAVMSIKTQGMPISVPWPNESFPKGSGRAGLQQWAPDPYDNDTPQISGDEGESGESSGESGGTGGE